MNKNFVNKKGGEDSYIPSAWGKKKKKHSKEKANNKTNQTTKKPCKIKSNSELCQAHG